MKEEIRVELEEIRNKLKPPSIAVIGGAGTGKSSLIKTVFKLKDNQIGTGAGMPQTQYYKKYPYPEIPGTPVILYDSPGYEPGKTDAWLRDTIKFINTRSQNKSIDDKIHLVWYVISASESRVFWFDKEVIETASALGLPILILLSKCDIARPNEILKLKQAIDDFNLKNLVKIIELSADPLIGESFGLDNLINSSIEMIPEVYADAFISAQTINIKKKKKVAWTFVAAAATTCFGSAFIPLPGTTPAAVITTQTSLLPSIATVYNVQNILTFNAAFATLSTTTVLAIIGTSLMDSVASTFMFLPPLFVVGETIAGATAATYIVVVGLAYISTLEALARSHLQSEMNREQVEKFFKDNFSKEFKKYSKVKVSNKDDLDRIKSEYIDTHDVDGIKVS